MTTTATDTARLRRNYEPEEIEALRKEIRRRLVAGKNTDFRQLMIQFNMSQRCVQSEIKVVKALLAAGQSVPAAGRARNWDGRTNPGRLRELKEQQKTESEKFLEIMKMQAVIYKLCAALENFHIEDCPLEEVALWRISDLLDDLISLGTWASRTTSAVQGWLGDADVRKKIEMLRDVRGRTPEEAKGFLKLADKLEHQLGNRLAQ